MKSVFAGLSVLLLLIGTLVQALSIPTVRAELTQRVDNLIVTTSDLEAAASRLAEWKNYCGIPSKVLNVTWIYSHYGGVDRPEQIRNCIKDYYANFHTKYVTIFGDTDKVPIRYAYVPDNVDDPMVPTDLYYADLDYSWDDNGDGRYGDLNNDRVDGVPDVYVGRIPTSFNNTAEDVVTKIIRYKQDLDVSEDWVDRVVLAAGGEAGNASDDITECISNIVVDKNIVKLLDSAGNLSTNSLAYEIDRGCLFLNFAGHARRGLPESLGLSPEAWLLGRGGHIFYPITYEGFGWQDALDRRNGRKLPVVVTMTCVSAKVDWESTLGDLLQGECEGEYFVMNPSGGAIAYFGSTGVAWCPDRGEDGEIYAPYYLMGDMDRQVYLAFYENHNRLGDMWGNALINYLKQPYYHQLNYYVNETEAKGYLNEKTVMEFILLGDPTLRIYNKPQTLDVPEDYATIQSAINDAYSGDAIRIAPGEYHENLIINKGVSLFGEDMEKTILDSFGVHVTAHDATISNLTIRNNNYGCITLSNAYDCNISRTILENSYMGIYLSNSSSNRLAGNILTNCSYGIFLDHGSRFNDVLVNTISDSGEGIYLFNECSDNTVWLNSIVGSHGYGIWIGNYSSDNWILNNSLTNTKNTAIFLLRALSNFVFANSISYSSYGGILLRDFCANNIIANNTASKNELGIMIDSSFDNEIYHNNFIDNVQQALIHPNGSLKNTWDNGYPSGGNYWSDHSGNDVYSGIFQNETGRDGIYDAPYVVRDNNRDNYPLAKPYYGPVRNLDDGQNYRSIQMAIDHASKRDRILVLSGTYHENIFVNKPVTLIGEGRNNTAIWGSGYRPAIDVISDETVISGFTIRGGWDGNGILLNGTNACSITNNLINYSHIGIWFVNSSRDRFTGNILTGCTYGILMGNNSCNNIILDNEISWNTDGIQLVGPSSGNNISYNLIHGNRDYGICLSNATGNGIVGNDLSEAGEVGVYLIGSSSNTLKGNTIVDCGLPGSHASGGGMFLNDSCDNNTITINIIANNAEYGIMLRLSSDNKISHNDFINNTEHAVVTREGFTKNSWDSGYPSGGNFWSGHNPPGKNKDKIGEIPYVIDENNTDNYPLIYPSKCYDPHYTSSPDINKDGKVDIRDVFVIAMAFGSTPGDPNWNPIADLNNDGTVNILDVFAVAWDFGKTV